MRHLVKVELTRLRWRRAVVVLMVAMFVIPLVVLAGAAWNTRPVSEADRAAAEQQAAQEAAQPWVVKELARCDRRPERLGGPGMTTAECVDMVTPKAENFLWRSELDVMSMIDNEATAAVSLMAILLFIVGTTFVGHDWNTGSMSNQLLFEPRRLRVWTAKAVAVSLTALTGGALTLACFWGATAGLVAVRELDPGAGTWGSVGAFSLRAVVLLVLAALAGYALTMLFRSTVATLAVAFIVVGAGSMLVLGVFGESRAMPWLLPSNAMAFLQNGLDYYVWSPNCEALVEVESVSNPCMETLTLSRAAVYLVSLIVAAVALSTTSIRRRDLP